MHLWQFIEYAQEQSAWMIAMRCPQEGNRRSAAVSWS
jgi:hypothetical protein